MKILRFIMFGFISWALLVSFSSVNASVYVHGYYRSNGTYVQPYYRSSLDSTITNNYSYCGNINPYTGAVGSVGCGSSIYTTPSYLILTPTPTPYVDLNA